MSDLQSLLKNLTTSAVSTLSYVYYKKETGKIHKISSKNIVEEGFKVFEIETDEVKPILTGERRIEEFIITYDVSLKQIRLKEVAYDDTFSTAATLAYQLPIIKEYRSNHIQLDAVFDGIEVYIIDGLYDYNKGDFVWHDNAVYKLVKDVERYTEFDPSEHKIVADDVRITKFSTNHVTVEDLKMHPEFVGIHVDVWYKELDHLAGQHVWLNNVVYKLLKDHTADSDFNLNNAEIITSNVKLYEDENESLKFNKALHTGDMILKNNNLYSIEFAPRTVKKDRTDIIFFNRPEKVLEYFHTDAHLTDLADLANGQIILVGKSLYQLETDKEYDVIVQQNTISKLWSILLNPYTKKFLQMSGYNPKETLYFSVTSKYDPNILYRSLEFTVGDLLSGEKTVIPFICDAEHTPQDVSIYTAKYFDNYAHEVI